MINGLNEFEKFKVIRPIIGNCEYDKFNMPIIRKTDSSLINWEKLKVIGIQNATRKTMDKNSLVLMFRYDKELMVLWNNPLKKIGLFQGFAAITTPDFSIYPTMNINEIRHNIYMARWLGVTWQNYNCTIFPTISWALPDTYDICFSGIEKGSIVVISTIGCMNHKDIFLAGFNEMKSRLDPPLIIVYGKMIRGMTGTFINFDYTDAFLRHSNYEQLQLFDVSRIFTIKET